MNHLRQPTPTAALAGTTTHLPDHAVLSAESLPIAAARLRHADRRGLRGFASRTFLRAFSIAGVILVLALTGCSSSSTARPDGPERTSPIESNDPETSPQPNASTSDQGPPGGEGSIQSSARPPLAAPRPLDANISADQVMQMVAKTGQLRLTQLDPPAQRGEVDATFSLQPGENGIWRHEVAGRRAETLSISAEGDIVMHRHESVSDNVAITYDPPAVIVPATMSPNQPYVGESRMTVVSLRDGSPRESGVMRYTITYQGLAPVPTPLPPVVSRSESFLAHRLRTERNIRLGLATVNVNSDSYYRQPIGLIYDDMKQEIKVLFITTRKHETIARLE